MDQPVPADPPRPLAGLGGRGGRPQDLRTRGLRPAPRAERPSARSPHAAVEAVWRIESGRLVAALTRITGDFGAAEDLAQDALERALRQWPDDGIPDHPASWLMATAKHLAVDAYRRRLTLDPQARRARAGDLDAQEEDPMAAVDEDLDTAVPTTSSG